jgi:hypothetical protein
MDFSYLLQLMKKRILGTPAGQARYQKRRVQQAVPWANMVSVAGRHPPQAGCS